MQLPAGTKLGPYEILGLLGAGGMGEVYRARDQRLARDVAIKVSAQQFNERFEGEARAIAALNHSHICQVYDVGPNYLVMEFIEGTPLNGPLPAEEALRYALQICDALATAHNKGIIHRDLKPANILVTAAGTKLLDFGLAKMKRAKTGTGNGPTGADDITQTMGPTQPGMVLGTAGYMSPEQAKAEELDGRSDIFSFGLVLYEMLSGRRAFARNSAIETIAAIVRDEPPPLDAPSHLCAVVARCLRKSPADRFQTMGEVRVALEQAGAAPAHDTPSIAVLPFANMSADKENEYFSDGLAEEILNLLAKIPGLRVIARTSAFAFRGKEQDVRKIAETLGVGNVLEGSVRRAGNRLRVTAQLISAADGSHLWSERYDRDMTDIFAIQDEIGKAISEALKVRLAPRTQTMNIDAYQNYLKGQYYRARVTPDNLAKAKGFFELALAVDPNYAPAYSGLAGYFYTLAVFGVRPTAEVSPLARSAAAKALALDPANSEAHSVLAAMAAICDYDWNASETGFRKAMAVEPVTATVRVRYAVSYLLPMGRPAEAIEESRLALETDPVSMFARFGLAWALSHAKRYQETIEYASRSLEIDANYHLIWFAIGVAQLYAGLLQEAIISLRQGVELATWWGVGIGLLAGAHYRAGDYERSQELAGKLGCLGQGVGTAIYHAATGELDAMLEALDSAYRQRDRILLDVRHLFFFGPYLVDPRFQALLQRMNLV